MKTFADYRIELPGGANGEIDVTCPECSHTRKKKHARCLSVNVEKGVWSCAHCGWSGGLGTGAKPGEPTEPEYGARLRTYEKPRPIPAVATPSIWQKAVAWFAAERGITEAALVRNGVTVATEWCPVCEEHTSHVLFPYRRNG